MSSRNVYAITSIGRPLDPAYPTNRAVIRLLPLAALIAAAAYGVRHGLEAGLLWNALTGMLAAFGGWALARELAPDHNPAAFAAMTLAFATWLLLDGAPVLPLFLCLFLVRIVNRSVGLPARISDAVAVTALAVGCAWLYGNAWLAFVGGMAFLLDATLPPGLTRQRAFAAVCIIAGGWLHATTGAAQLAYAPLTGVARWLPIGIAVAFVVIILLTRDVVAKSDATGEPLSSGRVRAGMWIGLFVAAQSLLLGREQILAVALVWASLAGAALHRPRSA